MNRIYKTALEECLILVGKTNNLYYEKGLEETILLDKFQDYVLNYNIHMGKRKVDSIANRSRKR